MTRSDDEQKLRDAQRKADQIHRDYLHRPTDANKDRERAAKREVDEAARKLTEKQ